MIEHLYEQLKRVEHSADSASERAISLGAIANAALVIVCKNGGEDAPEGDSILAKLNVSSVKAFFRERAELAEGLNFVRILRDNARHGKKIRPKDAQLSLEQVAALLDAIKGGVAPRPRSLSEKETRRQYIDVFLGEAGWNVREDKGGIHPGEACVEIKVEGMRPAGQDGYCDYVLFGRDNLPLAVVEAKRTIEKVDKGRVQAKLYAECLERRYGVKPVIYWTNGHTIWVDDRIYPERPIAAFHSLDDLERLVQRQTRGKIEDMRVNPEIAGRPYQIRAVRSVLERLNRKERHGLLVMATGTGKTRTVISLVEVLARHDWVKNVLFLADRTELVKQAYKAFAANYPSTTYNVLSQPSLASDPAARITLSTYQTLIRKIDGEEKLYHTGHFDLIVVDEAHRSIFNKYGIIFDYFDALTVGLTATPREQVDASTYEKFGCEQGVPDFEFSMSEGFEQGYLKPWKLFNRTTKVLREGIRYDDLSEAEKERYEEGFDAAGEARQDEVAADEIFRHVYNRRTCGLMLEELMRGGQKVEGGDILGKTIIFASNHEHAQMIHEVFGEKFPELAAEGYCELIDNKVKFADTLVDEFKDKRYPRIAVSVDMLDTGIDVPEILNLVYFRKVRSKIKFFQMLGRGTRVCKDVFGPGEDKERFYAFDYCGNFDYFIGEGGEGTDELDSAISLSQRIFLARAKLMLALQGIDQQSIPSRHLLWTQLYAIVFAQIKDAKDEFRRVSVRKVLPTLEKFLVGDSLKKLDEKAIKRLESLVAPVIEANLAEDDTIKRFDLKMLNLEEASITTSGLEAKQKEIVKIREIAKRLMQYGTIKEVVDKKSVLERMADAGFWARTSIEEIEVMRKETRGLMTLLKNDKEAQKVFLDVSDRIEWLPSVEGDGDYRTYREKVIDYLREHTDSKAVQKLYRLERLTRSDVEELEEVMIHELGSADDLEKAKDDAEYEGSLIGFLRTLIDLDEEAIQAKFGEFLNDSTLNERQHEFIESVVNYLRQNGEITVKDLIEKPQFKDVPIQQIFELRQDDLRRLVAVIKDLAA